MSRPRTERLSPGLRCRSNRGPRWEVCRPYGRYAHCESLVAEPVDDAQIVHASREAHVAPVLVCAGEATVNDPMEAGNVVGKLDIYPVVSSVYNLWGEPRESVVVYVGEIESGGIVDYVFAVIINWAGITS